MKDHISHAVFFSHPPEAVWQYLTDAELMSLWLMKNDFKPVVGHQFQFNVNPMPKLEFDGNIYCTVLEVEPFKKLSYSWKGGPGDGIITLDSIVVWTLEPKNKGTELHLMHNGFTNLVNIHMYDSMNNGWLSNMHRINDFLNKANHATTQS